MIPNPFFFNRQISFSACTIQDPTPLYSPAREEGFDPKQPGATELQRAARAVTAIVQQNAVFMQGNKPVRVRTTINYGGWDRQSASVVTTAYNKKAWLAGGCTLSKFADRGGGLSDGTIAI